MSERNGGNAIGSRLHRVALGLLATSLWSCTGASATAFSPGDADSSTRQIVGVAGSHMTLNDVFWLSRGVTLQAFVRPLAALQTSPNQAAVLDARRNYGPLELAKIRSFGADTIRFQVGQPALDPDSPLYDPRYFGELVAGIAQARRAGFVVMIMLQDEAISGETVHHPLPTAETGTDWDRLVTAFGADRGVVFELYNEPSLPATPANWQLWREAMQPLIERVRAGGAKNVLVLDGLGLARALDGVPPMSDPLDRLVYAVHPYQHGSRNESQWDTEFGAPSARMPVWADEWSAPAGLKLGLGTLPGYRVAVDLLNYLRGHAIPLCTGAFDVPPFVVRDVPGWTLTNYDDYFPGNRSDGSGTLVYRDFNARYSRELTPADGL
jgi:hypothetical protein